MNIQIKNRWTDEIIHEGDYISIPEALRGAIKSGANLTRANLTNADLANADLARANLTRANLNGANLNGANLTCADLTRADLNGANLTRANLTCAKNADLIIARTRILPEGDLIGYKKCQNGVIVKLKIPHNAKRSNAFGRKCRAEFAEVLEIFGGETAISTHDKKTLYKVGKTVYPDKWSEDWQNECDSGIHFFITKIEAEIY